MTAAALIARYFELAPSDDLEAYVSLFAADAVVEDDGRTHIGVDAVRAWHADVPSVTYSVVDVTHVGHPVATAEIAGDFPGSPVTLRFAFVEVQDGLIRRLTIAP